MPSPCLLPTFSSCTLITQQYQQWKANNNSKELAMIRHGVNINQNLLQIVLDFWSIYDTTALESLVRTRQSQFIWHFFFSLLHTSPTLRVYGCQMLNFELFERRKKKKFFSFRFFTASKRRWKMTVC